MPESALAKKLKLKPGQQAAVIGAPTGYIALLDPLPPGTTIATGLDGGFDWILAFVADRAALVDVMPRVMAALRADTLVWFAFPKGTSKVQSDLTRDRGWEAVPQERLKWVTLVSVDDRWSAFSLRPLRPGEAPRPRDMG